MFTCFNKRPELYLFFSNNLSKDDITGMYLSIRFAIIVSYTVLFPTVRVHFRLGVLKMFLSLN